MPNIKLRDGSGVETTYNNVDTITVPLADGTGTWKYSSGDFYNEDTFVIQGDNYPSSQNALANTLSRELSRQGATLSMSGQQRGVFSALTDADIDLSTIDINITNGSTQSFFNPILTKKLPRLHGRFTSVDNQYPWRIARATLSEVNACLDDVELNIVPTQAYQLYNWYESFACCSDYPPKLLNFLSRFGWNNTQSGYFNLKVGFLMKGGRHDLPVSSVASSTAQSWTLNGSPWPTLTFETDNGVPKTAQWARKTISFNGTRSGADNSQANHGLIYGYYGYGVPSNANLIGAPRIKELIGEDSDFYLYDEESSYPKEPLGTFLENHKNQLVIASNDGYLNFSTSYGPLNYTSSIDGTSQSYFTGYSKYNHTKAVETINSLPDCSEYCSSTGYTNTISFNKYLGELTDGGAINNLTEQEIAVAVDKGWTVALTTTA